MTRLALAFVLAVVLILTATAQAGNTTKIPILVVKLHKLTPTATAPRAYGLAPPVPCTAANRMDIFVDEDNILYECECQMLKLGTLCAWQVIGGVDPVAETRIRGKIAAGKLPKRFWYHARWRSLTVLR